jgi:hypothetical protein
MAKSYSEQLGEWVKQRKSTQRDKNLVSFLAVRDDVTLAVKNGYSIKTVWVNMCESKRIEFGYDTFLKYVNRLIRRPQIDQPSTLVTANFPTPTDDINKKLKIDTKKPIAKTGKSEALTGFTYNPVPNKEELL